MPKLTPEQLREIRDVQFRSHGEDAKAIADLLDHIDAITPNAKLGANMRELFDSTDNDFMFFENAEGDGNFTVVANYQDRDHERMYTGHGLNEAAAAAVKAMRKEAE